MKHETNENENATGYTKHKCYKNIQIRQNHWFGNCISWNRKLHKRELTISERKKKTLQ